MLKAIISFVITLGLAGPFARATAWQWAFVLTMPFPRYDEERIYRQIKGRILNKPWALSAVVGAGAVAAAMLATKDYLTILLLGFGVTLMV